jgi:thioesterase domain-containing protein
MQEIRTKGPRYALEWVKDRAAWELSKHRAAPEDTPAPGSFNNVAIEAAFREAAGAYHLRRWLGPITLYRPKLDHHWAVSGGAFVSAQREYVLPDNGWTQYCPQLDVVEVPGDHDGMVLVPNVGVLAGHLNALAAAADAGIETNEAAGWASRTAAE